MIRSIQEELFLDNVRRLAAGKMTSTMLEVAFDLDVFGKIQGRSVPLEELAGILEMPLHSARVLAQFLCREGMLLYRDGKLSNAPGVEPHLVVENRNRVEITKTVLKYTMTAEELKKQLYEPVAEHGYQRMGTQKHNVNSNIRRVLWGEELAQRYSFKGHRVLLDVAGASGGICIGICKTNPHLRCVVVDLQDSEEFARKTLEEAGAAERIQFVVGSFFEPLPRGADVALLSNIIHNWPPEQDKVILRNIHEALEPGGALLVKEAFFEDDWTGPMEPMFQAFFMGKEGWQPSYGDVEEMLRETGFVDLERRFDLVIGRKPA
jgi:ubiquinone/menaquinone biosynthesis C-methylase UbiE